MSVDAPDPESSVEDLVQDCSVEAPAPESSVPDYSVEAPAPGYYPVDKLNAHLNHCIEA